MNKYAKSIKNPDIIHYIDKKENRYLCNGACSITPSKSTRDKSKVTCKNCLNKLKLWGLFKDG